VTDIPKKLVLCYENYSLSYPADGMVTDIPKKLVLCYENYSLSYPADGMVLKALSLNQRGTEVSDCLYWEFLHYWYTICAHHISQHGYSNWFCVAMYVCPNMLHPSAVIFFEFQENW